ASQGGSSVALSGVGASVGVVLGAAISEDWIIGGDVWGVSAFSPSASNGASLGDQTLSLSGIGLNVTHYFMPENVYVSFSPSLVSLSLGNDQGSGSTNIGFGARLLVGKEWWVGNHWGLGLAGEAIFGVNSDQGGGPTWVTFGGAVLFTATYN
ncbi:MAG TPA: hypothetical protein VK454_11185, partial [Myxococcaceae bacterium]|nr:hypothetical protein [Myxococcaceae bacterium]